jgi:prophage regulatory protein
MGVGQSDSRSAGPSRCLSETSSADPQEFAVTNLRRAGLPSALSACDTAHSPKRLIPLAEVLARVPVCRAYFYELVRQGNAPAPVKIGKRSLWVEAELDAWVDSLAARRDAA